MRCGIITIRSSNYGNRLQNYALQKLLGSMGCEAVTLPLREGERLHVSETFSDTLAKLAPPHILQVASSRFRGCYPYKNQRDGLLRSMRLAGTNIPHELEGLREEAFARFDKRYISMGLRDDTYDAYVCGSDQIWNPTYSTTGADAFLRFAPEHKRIAFAPSFGLSELPVDLTPLYRKWLLDIPHLSVREESGAGIIRELTNRDVPVLPDPTLCVSREAWEAIERRPAFDDGSPFVLTYFLGNETNRYRKFIYSQAAGIKVVNLYDMREPEYYATDPAEFVWLVHHARAMFTDSFHGTAFSLIFHTPFVVFDRMESGGTAMASRIDTLLDRVGLQDRRFGKTSSIDDVYFTRSDEAIVAWAAEAKEYLRASLKEALNAKENVPCLPYVLDRKEDCSGCGACAIACPMDCIAMEADEEGFRYPKVDTSRCIHCDVCKKTCADALCEGDSGDGSAFIAWSKDAAVRHESSSGGMFSELAKETLLSDGVVYGAGFDGGFRVVHKPVDTVEALAELRGSKYVQSEAEGCFADVRERLMAGERVYFSGTPCQVDALLAYLGGSHPNLITQDIICHGVPSPAVWREYLAMCAKGREVKSASFRDKTYGWHYFSLRVDTRKGNHLARLDEDPYMRLFLSNVTLRPSCYACRHKHLHGKADLTLADCWGVERLCPSVVDADEGLSLVFANTEKGREVLRQTNAELVEVPYMVAATSQAAMIESVSLNPNRELFFAQAAEWGMRDALYKWFGWDAPVAAKAAVGYGKYRARNLLR